MRNINFASIHHMPWLEYRHALPDGRVCLRLQTGRGEFTRVAARVTSNYSFPHFFEKCDEFDMHVAYRDEWHDFYECIFEPFDKRLKYLFVLHSDECVYKLDASGLHAGRDAREDVSEAFAFAYAYPADPQPEWARGCVGYQIFPDRFRRAEIPGVKEKVEPWTSSRVQNEYRFGGNLRGVIEAVPYLQELGVTMLYSTPLFLSDTSHRYNTFDYFKIDPLLGTEDDLRELCDTLHANGMKLIMDGVFNHSGLGFRPFKDAKKKGKESKYYDWFFFDDKMPHGYHTFGDWKYMPKLNLRNEECAKYFLKVGRYWLEKCHIDGWRLDVSPEVWPDFWRKYKNMMREVNPESIMIAECWDDSREWLTQGDMFDSTMHYVLSRAIWSRFCRHDTTAEQFDWAVNRAAMLYPQRTEEVLWTFLGSHDTQRVRTRAGGDVRMLYGASFFQFTFLGAPIIYYGDELGMEGGDDPFCRFPMQWHNVKGNPVHEHYQKLAHIRAAVPALRVGNFRTWKVTEDGLYAYLRQTDDQQVLCVVNTALEDAAAMLALPEKMRGLKVLHDLYSGKTLPVENGCIHVSLKPGEGLILQ